MTWRKAGKIGGVTLLIVLALGGVAILAGYLFLGDWLESYLKKKVDKASQGQYELTINDISVDFTDFSIHFDSLCLNTDSSQLAKIRARKEKRLPLLNTCISQVVIHDVNALPIIFGGNLTVSKVLFKSPQISISYLTTKEKESEQKLSEFFDQISPALFDIVARKFEVRNGNFEYLVKKEKEEILLTDFSFQFNRFSFDSFSIPSAFFPSKDLKLLVEGELLIKRSSFTFQAKEVLSEDSEVVVNTLGFKTTADTVPDIDVSIAKVYANLSNRSSIKERALAFTSLYISKPDVNVKIEGESSGSQNKNKKALVQKSVEGLIRPVFNTVQADEVTVVNGDLMYLNDQEQKGKYLLSGIFVSLNDLLLAPNKEDTVPRFLYSQQAVVSITDSVFIKNDSLLFQGDFARLATDEGFRVENLLIKNTADPKCYPNTNYYELKIDELQAFYKNWYKLPKANSIEVPLVKVLNPDLYLISSSNSENRDSESVKRSIYTTVSTFTEILKVDSLLVLNGNFDVEICRPEKNRTFSVKELSAGISDILVDSSINDPNRFLFAKTVKATVPSLSASINNYKISTASVNLNTKEGVTVNDFVAFKKGQEKLTVQVPQLTANFTDWNSLLSNEPINIKRILLKRPDFNVTTKQLAVSGGNGTSGLLKSIEKSLPALKVEELLVKNGDLSFENQKDRALNVKVYNFDLSLYKIKIPSKRKNRFLFAKNFQLQVKERVKVSKNLYTVSLNYLEASSLSGLKIKNGTVTTDSSEYAKKLRKGKPTFYNFSIPKVTVSSVDWGALLSGEGTRIGAVKISNPFFKIIDIEEDHPPKESIVEIHKYVKPYVEWIKSDGFIIEDGRLVFTRYKSNDTATYSADKFDIHLNDILISSISPFSEDRVFYSQVAQLSAHKLKRTSQESYYQLSIDSIFLQTQEGVSKAFNINYEPEFPATQLKKYVDFEDDVVKLQIPDLKVYDFNWQKFFKKNRDVIAREVRMEDFNLLIIRDRGLPNEKETRPAPHELFRNLEEKVNIDSATFKNGYLAYTEIADAVTDTGTVFFSQVNMSLKNFTNIKRQLANTPIILNTSGMFLGKTPLEVEFDIDLFSRENAFTYHGKAGALNDLTVLNTILEPLAYMRLKSGQLNQITFKVDANEKKATGTMRAFYKNVEVELLDEAPGKDDKDIRSFFANLTLNSDNVEGSEDFRVGEIDFEREKGSSYLNYTWKAFRYGILSSLGVIKIRKVKNKIKDVIPFIGD